MKPKILLVDLPYVVQPSSDGAKVRSFHAFPYGLLSVATYNKHFADIRIFDCNKHETIEFLEVMRNFNPDIVGFSMMFDNSYKALSGMLYLVKTQFDSVTILGGAAASYSYEEILSEQPHLDAICYSEGEIPLRYVLETGKLDHPSIITRASLLNKTPVTPTFVEDLDHVINIDYSFVNVEDYDMQEAFSPFVDHDKHKQFFISTSRGCPFKCTFCSNAKIHGKKMRFASVDKIIKHIESLVDGYGMDVLTIYDDQLLIDMNRAKDLFRKLVKFNLRIECPNGLSVAFIDDELAGLMRLAGLDTAYLAIESGSPYVLHNLIKKPLRLPMVKPAVAILRKYDFFVHGFFVMGMPGEGVSHRLETLRFLKEIDLDWAGLNMATPVRGSQLYEDCIKNGWIEKQKIEDIVDKKYIIAANGNPKEIEDEVYRMNLSVNFFNNRRMRIRDYQTAARCFEEVLKRYPGHEWAKYFLEACKERMNG